MSLGDIAEIGKGFYTDNQDGIRRYDIDPKVYPEDIVGEVHADGEIICGAWYDTHLLLGGIGPKPCRCSWTRSQASKPRSPTVLKARLTPTCSWTCFKRTTTTTTC